MGPDASSSSRHPPRLPSKLQGLSDTCDPKNWVPSAGPANLPFLQPLLPNIPLANKTLVIQGWVNIYSVQTLLELKAEGHTKVKTWKRKSYLRGQCYNFRGVEDNSRWILTTSGVTWRRGETSGLEEGSLDLCPHPSGADAAEMIFPLLGLRFPRGDVLYQEIGNHQGNGFSWDFWNLRNTMWCDMVMPHLAKNFFFNFSVAIKNSWLKSP